MSNVRTRFAPSPTGFLHVGGVRTALFNYLYARKTEGKFLLRLEDTDRERFVTEGIEQIVEALEWLGLVPDEGFWISEGEHKNVDFVQSERHKTGIYRKFAKQLVAEGLAYYSPTSPDKLQMLRDQAAKAKKPFIYRKEMDSQNSSEQKDKIPIRLDVKAFMESKYAESTYFFGPTIIWSEPTHKLLPSKEFSWNSELIDDFILMKSDGFPTYNFANVVDDHEMKITHVMRGNEFISSTPKHIILYHALNFAESIPEFVHLPVINGTDGKKLSKRTGDTNALDYRDKGYPPEALLNFLALLGWNDGTEQEIFTLKELEEKFSLERVNTSPAVLDPKRLDWISGAHIRNMPLDELFEKVESYWPKEAALHNDPYKKQVLAIVQERLKFYSELPELTTFFFRDLPVDPKLISEHKQLKKLKSEDLKTLLQASISELERSPDFSIEDLTKRLNALLALTHTRPVVLFSLIRIATTQAPASPGLAETLHVLGREVSLRRMKEQLNSL